MSKKRKIQLKHSFNEINVQLRKTEIKWAAHQQTLAKSKKVASSIDVPEYINLAFDCQQKILFSNIRLNKNIILLLLIMQCGYTVGAVNLTDEIAELTSSETFSPSIIPEDRLQPTVEPTVSDQKVSLNLNSKQSVELRSPANKLKANSSSLSKSKSDEQNIIFREKFFKRLASCIDQGNLKACHSDLLEATRKPNSEKAECLFDFLHEHPFLIAKFLNSYHTRHLMPLDDKFEAADREILFGALRYQYNKKLLDAIKGGNFEETNRLLEFRWNNLEILRPNTHELIPFKFDYDKFEWGTLEPSLGFSEQAVAGLIDHIQEGDQAAAQWMLKHVQTVDLNIAREYAFKIRAAIEKSAYHRLNDYLKINQLTALENAISNNDNKAIISTLTFFQEINLLPHIPVEAAENLIDEVIDKNDVEKLKLLLDFNIAETFPANNEKFAKYVLEHIDNLNSAVKLLFAKRTTTISKALLLSSYKQELSKHPNILNLCGGNLHEYYYQELNTAIANNEFSKLKDIIWQTFFNSIHASTLFDYLVDNSHAISQFLNSWSKLFFSSPGSQSETLVADNRLSSFKDIMREQFKQHLQQAIASNDLESINKLLVFTNESLEKLSELGMKTDFNFDWSLINPSIQLSDEAMSGLLKLIGLGNKAAGEWLVEHILVASREECQRCVSFIKQVKMIERQPMDPRHTNKAKPEIYYYHLLPKLNTKVSEAIIKNDLALVRHLFDFAKTFEHSEVSLSPVYWMAFVRTPANKRSFEMFNLIFNYETDTQHLSNLVSNLIQQRDIKFLQQIFDTHPDFFRIEFIEAALRLDDDEIANSLMKYVKMEDINKPYHGGVYSPTTLLHQCARHNKINFAKMLLAKGAIPNLSLIYDQTPLAVALARKNFDFAWMLVDVYHEQGITITEDNAFSILNYVNQAYERAANGNISSAAKLLLFRATQDTTSQMITTTLIGGFIAIAILGNIIYQTDQAKKRPLRERKAFIDKAKQHLDAMPKIAEGLVDYINNINEIDDFLRDFVTKEALFPIAIIMSDGQNYKIESISQGWGASNTVSPVSHKPFEYRDFRLNINLMSYLALTIKEHINTAPLDSNLKEQYLENIDKLSKYFKLFNSLEECFCDPITKKKMIRPCVAPNGISYEAPYETLETSSPANIPGIGNVVLYRNYTLGHIIETHRPKETSTMEVRERSKINQI